MIKGKDTLQIRQIAKDEEAEEASAMMIDNVLVRAAVEHFTDAVSKGELLEVPCAACKQLVSRSNRL